MRSSDGYANERGQERAHMVTTPPRLDKTRLPQSTGSSDQRKASSTPEENASRHSSPLCSSCCCSSPVPSPSKVTSSFLSTLYGSSLHVHDSSAGGAGGARVGFCHEHAQECPRTRTADTPSSGSRRTSVTVACTADEKMAIFDERLERLLKKQRDRADSEWRKRKMDDQTVTGVGGVERKESNPHPREKGGIKRGKEKDRGEGDNPAFEQGKGGPLRSACFSTRQRQSLKKDGRTNGCDGSRIGSVAMAQQKAKKDSDSQKKEETNDGVPSEMENKEKTVVNRKTNADRRENNCRDHCKDEPEQQHQTSVKRNGLHFLSASDHFENESEKAYRYVAFGSQTQMQRSERFASSLGGDHMTFPSSAGEQPENKQNSWDTGANVPTRGNEEKYEAKGDKKDLLHVQPLLQCSFSNQGRGNTVPLRGAAEDTCRRKEEIDKEEDEDRCFFDSQQDEPQVVKSDTTTTTTVKLTTVATNKAKVEDDRCTTHRIQSNICTSSPSRADCGLGLRVAVDNSDEVRLSDVAAGFCAMRIPSKNDVFYSLLNGNPISSAPQPAALDGERTDSSSRVRTHPKANTPVEGHLQARGTDMKRSASPKAYCPFVSSSPSLPQAPSGRPSPSPSPPMAFYFFPNAHRRGGTSSQGVGAGNSTTQNYNKIQNEAKSSFETTPPYRSSPAKQMTHAIKINTTKAMNIAGILQNKSHTTTNKSASPPIRAPTRTKIAEEGDSLKQQAPANPPFSSSSSSSCLPRTSSPLVAKHADPHPPSFTSGVSSASSCLRTRSPAVIIKKSNAPSAPLFFPSSVVVPPPKVTSLRAKTPQCTRKPKDLFVEKTAMDRVDNGVKCGARDGRTNKTTSRADASDFLLVPSNFTSHMISVSCDLGNNTGNNEKSCSRAASVQPRMSQTVTTASDIRASSTTVFTVTLLAEKTKPSPCLRWAVPNSSAVPSPPPQASSDGPTTTAVSTTSRCAPSKQQESEMSDSKMSVVNSVCQDNDACMITKGESAIPMSAMSATTISMIKTEGECNREKTAQTRKEEEEKAKGASAWFHGLEDDDSGTVAMERSVGLLDTSQSLTPGVLRPATTVTTKDVNDVNSDLALKLVTLEDAQYSARSNVWVAERRDWMARIARNPLVVLEFDDEVVERRFLEENEMLTRSLFSVAR